MEKKRINIIGCGPGSADYLTPIASKHARSMPILVGATRLLDLFPDFSGQKLPFTGTPALLNLLESTPGKIGVLVSGDTTYFSLAESIVKHFGIESCELIPGISSIQVALSRFGLKQNTTRIISAHANTPDIAPQTLNHEESILILGGNPKSRPWLLELIRQTANTHILHICIDLTLDSEQTITLNTPSPETLTTYLEYSRLILLLQRRN